MDIKLELFRAFKDILDWNIVDQQALERISVELGGETLSKEEVAQLAVGFGVALGLTCVMHCFDLVVKELLKPFDELNELLVALQHLFHSKRGDFSGRLLSLAKEFGLEGLSKMRRGLTRWCTTMPMLHKLLNSWDEIRDFFLAELTTRSDGNPFAKQPFVVDVMVSRRATHTELRVLVDVLVMLEADTLYTALQQLPPSRNALALVLAVPSMLRLRTAMSSTPKGVDGSEISDGAVKESPVHREIGRAHV